MSASDSTNGLKLFKTWAVLAPIIAILATAGAFYMMNKDIPAKVATMEIRAMETSKDVEVARKDINEIKIFFPRFTEKLDDINGRLYRLEGAYGIKSRPPEKNKE